MAIGGARAVALGAILLGLVGSGCAATRSATDVVGGWFGRPPVSRADPSVRPSAWYAGSARVAVHAAPDASSEVVAELARHEAVLRYQRQGGFAFVVAEKSKHAGWVAERALIDRLPAVSKAVPAPSTPAAPEAPSTPEEDPGATEALPDGEPVAPAPPQKSIFDPY